MVSHQVTGAATGPQIGAETGAATGPLTGAATGPQIGVEIGPQIGAEIGPLIGAEIGLQTGVETGVLKINGLYIINFDIIISYCNLLLCKIAYVRKKYINIHDL